MNTQLLPECMNASYIKFAEFAEDWWQPEKPNKFVRANNLALSAVAIVNTLVKVIFSLLSFIPNTDGEWFTREIGNVRDLAEKGFNSELPTKMILPTLFKVIAQTLNPYALRNESDNTLSFDEIKPIECRAKALFAEARRLSKEGKPEIEGISHMMQTVDRPFNPDESQIPNVIPNNVEEAAQEEENVSKKEPLKTWCIREIGARALYVVATLAIIVEKLSYLAAGVFLAIGALCLGFTDFEVNKSAMKYLQALDLIEDVCMGLRAAVNPSDFIECSLHLNS